MAKYIMRSITLTTALILSVSSAVLAETWRLAQGHDWKPLSKESQNDKYLLAVANIKKLLSTTQCKAALEELNQLKKDFPEIAGPDLDAFIKAEVLFCKGKFFKALNSYDRFLERYYHESELYTAALERQFRIGKAFLAGRKKKVLGIFKLRGYAEGEKIMENISERAGDTPIGMEADIAVAQSYEKRGKFEEAFLKWNEAYDKWEQAHHKWPESEKQRVKDALLGMARCKYTAYKGPSYDAANLVNAKSYYEKYEQFRSQNPEYAEDIGIDAIRKVIKQRLAYKQFSIGQYYQRAGNRQTANFYYQMVIDVWPNTRAAELAKAAMDDKKARDKKEKKWKDKALDKIEKWFL